MFIAKASDIKEWVEQSSEISVYATLRWHELFDKYSPDTYHPKLLGTCGLVEEMKEIASLAKGEERWKKHLTYSKLELGEKLKNTDTTEAFSALELTYLSKLADSSTSASDTESITRLFDLEGIADRIRKEQIAALISYDDSNNQKSKIDKLLRSLATKDLRDGANCSDFDDFEKCLGKPIGEVASWITKRTRTEESDYTCIVFVELNGLEESVIRSVSGLSKASPNIPGLADERENKKEGIYLKAEERGNNSVQVLRSMRDRIQRSLNMISVYNHSKLPVVSLIGWVLKEDVALKVDLSLSGFNNIHPRRGYERFAKESFQLLEGHIKDAALGNAIEMYNVALKMDDPRLKLVNLWSALECLASFCEGRSILDKVNKLVLPIITWRRVSKILGYNSISLHYWLKENPTLNSLLPEEIKTSNFKIRPDKLMHFVAQAPDKVKPLIPVVVDHPLLKYRIQLLQETFSEQNKMKLAQDNSHRHLEWHLARIYRARNLLVHEGRAVELLPQLSENLQSYLSHILTRILHGLGKGPTLGVKESIEYWTLKSSHINNGLSKRGNAPQLYTGDFFANDSDNVESEMLWK
jgi:hypothetical protein